MSNKNIKKKINIICLNSGYILDGYAKVYKNDFNLFNEDIGKSKIPDDQKIKYEKK